MPTDSRTLPLVKEQLLLLCPGRVNPGRGRGGKMAAIARDAEEGESGMEATESLDPAGLGAVEAKLRFGVDGFCVDFVCERFGSSALQKEGGMNSGRRSPLRGFISPGWWRKMAKRLSEVNYPP